MTETAPDRAGRVVDRPLLVFDGDCGFCTTSAGLARRWVGLEHVEAWQFLDLDSIGLTEAQCQESVQWVAADGSTESAERAVIAALRHAGGAWRVLGEIIDLPGVRHGAAVVYRVIAKYRHHMPGGTPACKLPARDRSAE